MAYISKFKDLNNNQFDLRAYKTAAIPTGTVSNTSTSIAFTATIDGINSLYDGVCVFLKNNKVTSASGCTLNINSLGAKPIYSSAESATAIVDEFKLNTTVLFIYNSSRVANGCWDMYFGGSADGIEEPTTSEISAAVISGWGSTVIGVADTTKY